VSCRAETKMSQLAQSPARLRYRDRGWAEARTNSERASAQTFPGKADSHR
jgi:hypothetical protein